MITNQNILGTMKRLYITILSIATAAGISTTTARDSQNITALDIFGDKVISQISDEDGTSTFDYNDKFQLTSVTTTTPYGTSSAVFDYTPGTINGEAYDVKLTITDPGEKITCYLTLGDNGFISKSYEIEESAGEKAEYETYIFEYNDDNQLDVVSETGFLYNETVHLYYEKGNVTWTTKIDEDTEVYNIDYTTEAAPAPIANKGKIMDFDAFGFDNFEATYFYYAGLLGAPTTDLPIKSTQIDTEGTETTTYAWTTDENGYPTMCKSYEGTSLDDTVRYSWRATNGIADINADTEAVSTAGYYDITGVRHNAPVEGINIIKNADGTTTKIIHK